ncbi:S41 family peptidase [uncultured Lutibacter sp.]|uniref:S41 family peptidase n=1 Tax=uncultured Lutibacter sp. TaxID=437739 RepID=UPI002636F18E|nr:S41 family peptidase [uncultured Lutibacter sp.]
MKKVSFYFSICLVLAIGVLSCTKNDNILIPQNVEIQDFVWKGMNSWYNWQSSVENLADTKDSNQADYVSYLNGYTTPESLFESLLFDPGNTDRFSWFVEDYIEQNNAFQGITTSFGLRLKGVFLENNNDAILYVRYVAPNSAADNAGIKRGDIIRGIDGTTLNQNNFNSEVGKFSNESITLTFVSENAGVFITIEHKTITATELSENPVYFKTVFNDVNGKKVGYLVYNSFRSSYNDELNAAFSYFQSEGIDELILDLRLNGGGSVLTSAYLASMIYNNSGSDIFAELKFNSKHPNENGYYYFDNTLDVYDVKGDRTGEESINRLTTINQLYVITSSSTASASEMIINGLRPFIPVKLIGTTTYGKNVGSITLYDSPSSEYTNIGSANPDHLNAMQPIVFQIYNKSGQSDYTHGFNMDIEVVEDDFWNAILPFGDENEVVLKAALDDIRGLTGKSERISKYKSRKSINVTELENKFEKEMYIDATFFNQ